MTGKASLRQLQAMERTLPLLKLLEEFPAPIQMSRMCSPAADDQIAPLNDFLDVPVVVDPDRTLVLLHHFRISRPKRKRVQHSHFVKLPVPGKLDTSSDSRVVLQLRGGRRVQTNECHSSLNWPVPCAG